MYIYAYRVLHHQKLFLFCGSPFSKVSETLILIWKRLFEAFYWFGTLLPTGWLGIHQISYSGFSHPWWQNAISIIIFLSFHLITPKSVRKLTIWHKRMRISSLLSQLFFIVVSKLCPTPVTYHAVQKKKILTPIRERLALTGVSSSHQV
jgi:hypothetical protein